MEIYCISVSWSDIAEYSEKKKVIPGYFSSKYNVLQAQTAQVNLLF